MNESESRLITHLAIVGVLAVSNHVMAHPLIDRARSEYEEAAFQASLGTLREAERASDLTREDVIQLLETRALASAAVGEATAVEAALTQLASLDPAHELRPEATPALRATFDRIREAQAHAARLEVELTEGEGTVTLEPRATGDPARLVRRLRVRARENGAPWQSAEDEPLTLELSAGTLVRYFAEGIGPGGAVLLAVGSRDVPIELTFGQGSGGVDEGWVWAGAIGGALLAIGAALAIGFAVDAGSSVSSWQPGPPMFP